jgi:hypothetical protein
MFNLFRRRVLPGQQSTDLNPSADPIYPPQIHQFANAQDWLRAWVDFRLCELKQVGREGIYEINGGAMLPLIGSLGYDSAIAADGVFWIWLDDFSETEESTAWRVASSSERTWLIVCAQRRRFPEFSALLPFRPFDAIACGNCFGSGFILQNSVVCADCCALGWLMVEVP